jgi:hypothetical protein
MLHSYAVFRIYLTTYVTGKTWIRSSQVKLYLENIISGDVIYRV